MSDHCPTRAVEVADFLERSLTTPNVTVTVGKSEDARTFYIHRGLACQHSEFFAAQMRGVDQDETQPIILEQEKSRIFEVFARFLYSGKVYSQAEGDASLDQGKPRDKEWGRLAQAWKLGDTLQSPSFKDAVVDTICEKMALAKKYPVSLYMSTYATTSEGASLRRLVVDIAVWCWGPNAFGETTFHESWNQFFRDLALRQHEMGKDGLKGLAPFETPSCNYHEHGNDSPCYKTMF